MLSRPACAVPMTAALCLCLHGCPWVRNPRGARAVVASAVMWSMAVGTQEETDHEVHAFALLRSMV